MKRSLSAITAALLSLLLLSGCELPKLNRSEPAAVTPEPTEAVTAKPAETTPSPAPKTSPATVLADDLPAVSTELHAGDEVTLTSESGDFYLCLIGDKKLYVEKRFIRLSGEVFEEWKGYASEGAEVYESVYLAGEPFAVLAKNDEVTVLAEMGSCLAVRLADGSEGYMRAEWVSTSKASSYRGGSGKSDGGDIHLSSFGGIEFSLVLLSDSSDFALSFPCEGSVLADGVEASYCFFYRGDVVDVISVENGFAEILYYGQVLTLPEKLLRTHDMPAYTAWEGYAQEDAVIYSDYRMQGQAHALEMNSSLVILEEFEECYYVEFEGKRGYMELSLVSDEEVKQHSHSYNPGSGSTGGWTPPQL